VALDARNGAVDVGDVLALGGLADQHVVVFGEGDDRRGRAEAFCVCDNGGFSTLENCDDRVGRSQVDSYCTSHMLYLLFVKKF
jgi:hypothetical protein